MSDIFSPTSLALFLASAAMGSYFQAVTGFALGIIVLGITVLTGIATVAETANALSIMTVCNVGVAMPKVWRHMDWTGLSRLGLGMLPGLIGGVLLLGHLSSHYSALLRLLVGALVMSGGAFLFLRPKPMQQRSGPIDSGVSGAAAGVLTGLFSIGGPALVYYYYRQPVSLAAVRATLLSCFALLSTARLITVGVQGGITLSSMQQGVLAVPVVAAASWFATRHPPPLSDGTVRRGASFMLTIMGAFIVYMTTVQI